VQFGGARNATAATRGLGSVKTYRFTKFPKIWADCLAAVHADGCAYRVALYLLNQARWSRCVTLSTAAMQKLGVSRNGKRSALKQLREAGVIAVEDRPHKSPIVTVRFL
jgi:hypothetical protein